MWLNCLLIGCLLMVMTNNVKGQEKEFQQGVLYVKVFSGMDKELYRLLEEKEQIGAFGVNNIEHPFKDGSEALKLIYRIHFDAGKPCDSLMNILKSYDFIDYVERIPVYHLCYMPNDFNPLHQWGLLKVHAEEAWDINRGKSSVVIAVVDNAVRTSHHDLAANMWVNAGEIPNNGIDDDGDGYIDDVNGWDVADNDNNPNPPAGINANSEFNHGSHVSGIASAVTDNGIGVASLAFNCSIMAVKSAPDTSGGNDLTNPYDGVYYAVKAKANIINMSFETTTPEATGQSMIDFAYNSGVVCVAAAGNDSSNAYRYPAMYRHVIGVGSTDANDKKSPFSNYGHDAAVMAPGTNILSTMGFNDVSLGYLEGTSMSSPLVCSLAGLVLSENPKLNPDEVKYYIQAGCDNIDALNPAYSGQLGSGRINAFNTLKLVQQDTAKYATNSIINIFPNPCNNTCNIRFNQRCINADFSIMIHNVLGQKVYEGTVSNFNGFYYPLNLISLRQGVFYMQIIMPDMTLNTIIVKGESQ